MSSTNVQTDANYLRKCSWSGFRLNVHTDANANICRNRSRRSLCQW